MDYSQIASNMQTNEQIFNNNSTKLSTITVREEKLMTSYNKLKTKYEQKVKENKMLRQTLDTTIESVKTLEDTFKTIQGLYSQCKDWMSHMRMPSSTHVEFSTTELSNNNRQTNKIPESIALTNNPISTSALLKKIDEFELFYNEMSRSFNNLVVKYKILKEEKNKIEDSSLKLLSRYSQLEKQYEDTIRELYSKYDEIKRFEEIDKCLLDFCVNSFMLKVDTRDPSNLRSVNIQNDPGIKCEPVPTFARFLAFKK